MNLGGPSGSYDWSSYVVYVGFIYIIVIPVSWSRWLPIPLLFIKPPVSAIEIYTTRTYRRLSSCNIGTPKHGSLNQRLALVFRLASLPANEVYDRFHESDRIVVDWLRTKNLSTGSHDTSTST